LIKSISTLFIRSFFLLLFVISNITTSFCQNFKNPEDYGFRYLVILYQGDSVNILVRSAKGEENNPKPLLFFCQGSLPVPLILFDEKGGFGTFPFNADSLSKHYHIAIAGKPFIPVMADIKILQTDYCYRDSTGRFPAKYSDRNLLSYYTARNLAIITFLQNQPWVSKDKLIVAGHSEGSTIAAKMASQSKKITHLIYSGGSPFGRILTIITRSRGRETDSVQYVESNFKYWEQVVQNPDNSDASKGDNNKNMYEFSIPPFSYLENLRIPVLVSYGTKDIGAAPFNDYLRAEMIRRKKTNFTFNAYFGTEHNYFGVKPGGQPDYDQFNWDRVAMDWLKWLKKN
jgi:dienelactone hydrolase